MQEAKPGRRWKRAMGIAVLVLAAIIGAIALMIIAGTHFLVDFFWFDSLGYSAYFFQRWLYRYGVFLLVAAFFFAVFFLNIRIAASLSGEVNPVAAGPGFLPEKSFYERRLGAFMLLCVAFSLALAVLMALPAFLHWEKFLFFIFGPASGVQDPHFGHDVSFYLFRYPVYTLMLNRLRLSFGLLLTGTFLLYAMRSGFFASPRRFPSAAKRHVAVLVLVMFLIEIWAAVLQLFGLVYDTSNLPTFYGPGYVQMNVTRPLLLATMLLLAAMAFTLYLVVFRGRGKRVLAAVVLALGLVVVVRSTNQMQRTVWEYLVKPNQLARETPYIAANIQATLSAYALNNVEYRDFKYERLPEKMSLDEVRSALRNIPVWNVNILETVFHQLQELRAYYAFPPVSAVRYTVNGHYQQVFLAPRELDYDNLPESAQNWINRHMTYTHGFGTVMVPANQDGGTPMTWYSRGIPPVSEFGLTTEQPRIYHGKRDIYHYVIAPNDSGELDYPEGASNVLYSYQGKTGVPIGSMFKKALFAYYFRAKEIFFTTKTRPDSKILFRRNIIERVNYLAPYLRLDDAPYAVQTPKGIYWIIDAYISSDAYPVSAPYLTPTTDFNYIRNSVKIVVDAYHGTADFYVFDESDPIIQAYRRIYPNFFKSKESLPQDLRSHIRYPIDIFNIQMRIYARYHQTDPAVFFQQEDLWTFADTVKGDQIVQFRPYYITVNLMQEDRLDFLLLLPMMPQHRKNLRVLALAGSDDPYYGKIVIYSFPKGELVHGPEQINAIINQDPQIAELFTLWDQAGSSVMRGDMVILPLGNSVLFVQPVYLSSRTDVHIPELQRLIVSEGQVAVIESSLEEAYSSLKQRIERERDQKSRRFAAPDVPAPTVRPPGADGPGPLGPEPTPRQPDSSPVPPEDK